MFQTPFKIEHNTKKSHSGNTPNKLLNNSKPKSVGLLQILQKTKPAPPSKIITIFLTVPPNYNWFFSFSYTSR